MTRAARGSAAAVGIVFGFVITESGFGNYTTIHQALLFRGWYLYAAFGSALAVAVIGLTLLRRAGTTVFGGRLRLPHRGAGTRHLYGAAVFGAGFGITGTCPGGSMAMVATGGIGGLLVLAGLITGLRLRGITEHASRSGPTESEPAAPERRQPAAAHR